MSILTYNELVDAVNNGVITGVPLENINGASIEVTLHSVIQTEIPNSSIVDLARKQVTSFRSVDIPKEGYNMYPEDFILASTQEIFNLPDNIIAEYTLKSSLARNGLEHLHAGYCDPTWNGSRLTLELKNVTRHHLLKIRTGMKIGQIKLIYGSSSVPEHISYAKVGQYNHSTQAEVKAVR